MDKHELVGMTIKQLIEHFKSSPESFEYYDQTRKPNSCMQPTIVWQPKVQLGDYMSTVVQDPNNSHAVVVSFNDMVNELTCYLFLKAPTNLVSMNASAIADCIMTSKRSFEKWRGNYRKFKKLRDLIIARDKHKENLTYLKKLSSVFPDTMDTHLLDK
jgi:hypothetical protein